MNAIPTSYSIYGSCNRASWAIMGRARALTGNIVPLFSLLVVFFLYEFFDKKKGFNGHRHTIGILVFGNSSLWGEGYLAVGILVLIAYKEVI